MQLEIDRVGAVTEQSLFDLIHAASKSQRNRPDGNAIANHDRTAATAPAISIRWDQDRAGLLKANFHAAVCLERMSNVVQNGKNRAE